MCQQIKKLIECDGKAICCRVQNAGLRTAIKELESSLYGGHIAIMIGILDDIYNLLQTYACLPGTCLLERVQHVLEDIKRKGPSYGKANIEQTSRLKILIAELKTFLDDN